MKRLIFAILLLASTAQAQYSERKRVCVTPTVTAGAYTAYDNIGGLLTFPNVLRSTINSGVVTSAKVYDLSSNIVAYELGLFSTNPSATTFTDNAAIDVADADLGKILGPIAFTTSDRYAFADNSVSTKHAQYLPVTFTGAPRNIYGALRSTGTPTFAGTSDITVCITVEGD
jgi:hypothetical protein